jgi:MoxR-like ATPase
MHVVIDYPDDNAELKIMRLNREEQHSGEQEEKDKLAPEIIFAAREEIAKVKISEPMERYIVDIISATRYPEKYSKELDEWLDYGASPRGSIAIDRSCRARAWVQGNDFVSPDDIRAVVHDCLRHRLILSYEANAEGITADKVLDEILEKVAVIA